MSKEEEDKPKYITFSDFASFDDSVLKDSFPPFTITIAGHAGTGKTSLALSISDVMPVYVIETENRINYLHKRLRLKESANVRVINVLGWDKMKEAVGALYRQFYGKGRDGIHGCVIIDSGTDYKNYASATWADEGPTFPTTNYGRLYTMMDNPIAMLKSVGLSVIFTVRMKQEYKNNEATDLFKPDLFKNQAYLSDAILIFNEDGTLSVNENKWADITKLESTIVDRNDRLPSIIKLLMEV